MIDPGPLFDEAFDYTAYNILLVDDLPVNLAVMVDYLRGVGFGVRIARSGESALQRVAYDRPDLILLDVLLPGIDGFETCRRLKAQPETEEIPVIFMTSLTSIQDKVQGFEVGAVDFVTKPLQQEEVLARITTHLRLRDLTRSLQEKNQELEVRNRIEKARLFDAVSQQRLQLQALNSKLTEVQENERKELARELHDEMGQALTAININLSAVRKEMGDSAPPHVRERLDEALSLTGQTLEQIREISLNLRPAMLDDLGLVPTLRWYVKRYGERMGIETQFQTEGLQQRLSPAIETTLYRVVQEALTNVARHAQASHVALHLSRIRLQPAFSDEQAYAEALSDEASSNRADGERRGEIVRAMVQDNGLGFDVNQVLDSPKHPSGMGLMGMHERITLVGGSLSIHASPGKGTLLSIEIPLRPAG